MAIYRAIIATPNDGTLGNYALERGPVAKIEDLDIYISAGRSE